MNNAEQDIRQYAASIVGLQHFQTLLTKCVYFKYFIKTYDKDKNELTWAKYSSEYL